MIFTPNFNFSGRCAEAMKLYAEAFGARVGCQLRYRDADPKDFGKQLTDEQKEYVYHGELYIGDRRLMMMCDNMDVPPSTSYALSLTVTFDCKEDVLRAYDVLKDGSATIYPVHSTTYSSCEVVFVDKFGFRWGLMTEQTER